LGHKKRESCRGLLADSVANLLGFSTLSHTHDFGNHKDGHGHSATAFVRSLMDSRKSDPSIGLTSKWFWTAVRFMTFKLAILLT
jgi:hypothetical protein